MRRLVGVLFVLSIVVGSGGLAAASPLLEKDVNLDEANRLADILRAGGINVIMTRTGDSNPSLADRAHLGGQGDLLVSVHNNSDDSPSAHGTEVYAQLRNADSMRLARSILAGVVDQAGTTSRGALTRQGEMGDYYSILRNSPVPAVIVEGAFLSSPGEAAELASPDFRQRLAQGIANGIFAVVEHAEPAGTGPPPTPTVLNGATMNPPGALTATRTGGGDLLTWQSVGLASGYEVWRDGALAGVSPTTSFTDPSPGVGRHHYDVRAVLELAGLRLEQSPPASVEIGGGTVVIDPGHGGADSGAVGDA